MAASMSSSSTVTIAPNVTSKKGSTEESNSPNAKAVGTMLQSKTAPTVKRSITYPIPVVNDSLHVRGSTEESNSPNAKAVGTMLQSKTAPTVKRSITYPIPVVNDSLHVRGSTEESNSPNAKAKAVGTSRPSKTVPTVIKRSITDPTSVGNESLTKSTSFSNKPESLLGERKDSKDYSKMEVPQGKVRYQFAIQLTINITTRKCDINIT